MTRLRASTTVHRDFASARGPVENPSTFVIIGNGFDVHLVNSVQAAKALFSDQVLNPELPAIWRNDSNPDRLQKTDHLGFRAVREDVACADGSAVSWFTCGWPRPSADTRGSR